MPQLGFGTFRMQGDVCRAAVESALALGYRHLDTAEMYANEEAVGAAIAAQRHPARRSACHDQGLERESGAGRDAPRLRCQPEEAAARQVDLYLVHWPTPGMNLPSMLETMMKLKEEGRTRAIGVANFNIALLRTVVEEIKAPIACNQIEYHVMLDQTKVQEIYGRAKDSAGGLLPAGAGPRCLRRDDDGESAGSTTPARRRWR